MFHMFRRVACLLVLSVFVMSCNPRAPKVTSTPQKPMIAPTSVNQPSNPTTTPASESQLPPTSNDLIDTALEKGEIDPPTALKYKVFSEFTDPRLPEKFQSSIIPPGDSHIIDELQAQFSSLPVAVQQEMLPFLMPANYKGSWADPSLRTAPGAAPEIVAKSTATTTVGLPGDDSEQPTPEPKCTEIDFENWEYKSAMHSPVRFWWQKAFPSSEAAVDRFIAAMDDEVWPRLTGLMGRTPLPDDGSFCNGGSPDLDILVTPMIERSNAPSITPPGCKETPSYININPGETNAILAHEFFHDIQWSYNTAVDCMYPGNYAWLAEATASWSQNYVYPDDNAEHEYIKWFFSGGTPPKLDLKNDKHEYGAHLFFFYLTNKFGRPDIVKTVWDNATSMPSLEAVDKAIPGGIKDVWGEFAVENMDEPPYDDYQQWDQMNIKPSGGSLTLTTATTGTYNLTDQIDHLSIMYDWFNFEANDRLITFFNGLTYNLDDEPINSQMGILQINDGTSQYKFNPAEDVDQVKIQAYFKVAGDTDWQLEDWTDKPYVSFCRDAQAEKLTDLVIITSNSSLDQDVTANGSYKPRLQVSDIGCYRYGGNASLKMTGKGEGGAFTDEQILPNVAFERTDAHPNIPYPILHFKVAEGNIDRTYSYKGTDNGCTGLGTSNNAIGSAPPQMFGNDLYVLYGAISGSSANRYSGQADSKQSINVNFSCPDGTTTQSIISIPWFYSDVLSQVLEKKYIVSSGGVLDGSDNLLRQADNATMSYMWHFEPLAETGSEGTSSAGLPDNGSSTAGGSGGSGSGPSAPPSSPSANIPTYPNIDTVAQNVSGGGYSFTTTDAPEDVANFYKEAYTNMGWTDLSGSPNGSQGEVIMLNFSSGSKIISIMISKVDDKTMVNIFEVGG